MATLNEESCEKKLTTLTCTQDSIQTLSLWIIHHKVHHKKIVELWFKVLKKAKIPHRLTLFNLCNDVVQNGKRKHANVFLDSFKKILPDAITFVQDESVRRNIDRILNIWQERNVFDGKTIQELQSSLTSGESTASSKRSSKYSVSPTYTPSPASETNSSAPTKKPSKYSVSPTYSPGSNSSSKNNSSKYSTSSNSPAVNPKLLADFKPQTMIEKINSVKILQNELDLKSGHISTLKLDASNIEAVKKLKDKAHGTEFSRQFEDSVAKMEDFKKLLETEVEDRASLIEMLQLSELYYDEQYREAKIVANAYKNFGTRINNMKRKLDELKKLLPDPDSPLPSPSSDAPSPETTPPEVDSSTGVAKSGDESSKMSSAEKGMNASGDMFTLEQRLATIMPNLALDQPAETKHHHKSHKSRSKRSKHHKSDKHSAYSQSTDYRIEDKGTSGGGGSTPLNDEGSSTPVQDEQPEAPAQGNPIELLSKLLAQTQKTHAPSSTGNFMENLSILTSNVKKQLELLKHGSPPKSDDPDGSPSASSEKVDTANSWASWKAKQQAQVTPPPTSHATPPQDSASSTVQSISTVSSTYPSQDKSSKQDSASDPEVSPVTSHHTLDASSLIEVEEMRKTPERHDSTSSEGAHSSGETNKLDDHHHSRIPSLDKQSPEIHSTPILVGGHSVISHESPEDQQNVDMPVVGVGALSSVDSVAPSYPAHTQLILGKDQHQVQTPGIVGDNQPPSYSPHTPMIIGNHPNMNSQVPVSRGPSPLVMPPVPVQTSPQPLVMPPPPQQTSPVISPPPPPPGQLFPNYPPPRPLQMPPRSVFQGAPQNIPPPPQTELGPHGYAPYQQPSPVAMQNRPQWHVPPPPSPHLPNMPPLSSTPTGLRMPPFSGNWDSNPQPPIISEQSPPLKSPNTPTQATPKGILKNSNRHVLREVPLVASSRSENEWSCIPTIGSQNPKPPSKPPTPGTESRPPRFHQPTDAVVDEQKEFIDILKRKSTNTTPTFQPFRLHNRRSTLTAIKLQDKEENNGKNDTDEVKMDVDDYDDDFNENSSNNNSVEDEPKGCPIVRLDGAKSRREHDDSKEKDARFAYSDASMFEPYSDPFKRPEVYSSDPNFKEMESDSHKIESYPPTPRDFYKQSTGKATPPKRKFSDQYHQGEYYQY